MEWPRVCEKLLPTLQRSFLCVYIVRRCTGHSPLTSRESSTNAAIAYKHHATRYVDKDRDPQVDLPETFSLLEISNIIASNKQQETHSHKVLRGRALI